MFMTITNAIEIEPMRKGTKMQPRLEFQTGSTASDSIPP